MSARYIFLVQSPLGERPPGGRVRVQDLIRLATLTRRLSLRLSRRLLPEGEVKIS